MLSMHVVNANTENSLAETKSSQKEGYVLLYLYFFGLNIISFLLIQNRGTLKKNNKQRIQN